MEFENFECIECKKVGQWRYFCLDERGLNPLCYECAYENIKTIKEPIKEGIISGLIRSTYCG